MIGKFFLAIFFAGVSVVALHATEGPCRYPVRRGYKNLFHPGRCDSGSEDDQVQSYHSEDGRKDFETSVHYTLYRFAAELCGCYFFKFLKRTVK
jgi:hypothetical protein